MKRRVLITSTLLLLCIASYLLTYGHFFLPLPTHPNFANEKLETRELSIFEVPNNLSIGWRLTYPGRAKFVDASQGFYGIGQNPTQIALEKLGYKFPPGCSVVIGDRDGGMRITHYPSMLDRIQKDFRLKMLYKVPPDAEKRPSAK